MTIPFWMILYDGCSGCGCFVSICFGYISKVVSPKLLILLTYQRSGQLSGHCPDRVRNMRIKTDGQDRTLCPVRLSGVRAGNRYPNPRPLDDNLAFFRQAWRHTEAMFSPPSLPRQHYPHLGLIPLHRKPSRGMNMKHSYLKFLRVMQKIAGRAIAGIMVLAFSSSFVISQNSPWWQQWYGDRKFLIDLLNDGYEIKASIRLNDAEILYV
jgi:hypothetical protein